MKDKNPAPNLSVIERLHCVCVYIHNYVNIIHILVKMELIKPQKSAETRIKRTKNNQNST